VLIVLLAGAVYAFIKNQIVLGIVLTVLFTLLSTGIRIVQPNQARVIMFFGNYIGTLKDSGIWFVVPLSIDRTVSLRVRNFNSKTLKVNDVEGNPIEIAAVVVFRVVNSAKAVFDVDDYEEFVEIQSETALRHVATKYPYDLFEEEGYSLRGNTVEIAEELCRELQERLAIAGVEVLEARLTILLMPQRSPALCCSASRLPQFWPPARRLWKGPWVWLKWPSLSWNKMGLWSWMRSAGSI